MANVRLFGRAYPHAGKPVKRVKLRVAAHDLPEGAAARVTDLQLQPGAAITGYVPATTDHDIQTSKRWQFRNGVIRDDMTVIVFADTEAASPTRWDVRGANGRVKIGAFDFGTVSGSASVDGTAQTATHGAGIPPHITARSDLDVPVEVEGRTMLCAWFRGLATTDPNVEPES